MPEIRFMKGELKEIQPMIVPNEVILSVLRLMKMYYEMDYHPTHTGLCSCLERALRFDFGDRTHAERYQYGQSILNPFEHMATNNLRIRTLWFNRDEEGYAKRLNVVNVIIDHYTKLIANEPIN